MRRHFVLLGLLVLPAFLACKHPGSGGDGGADGAASASASVADTASAAPSASAAPPATATVVRVGPPSPGVPCKAGDTNACAPGGFEELACTGGVWRITQTCRGPGACKGTGAAVACDVGTPLVGDACVAGAAAARCKNPQTAQACTGGKWTESVCVPPGKCQAGACK